MPGLTESLDFTVCMIKQEWNKKTEATLLYCKVQSVTDYWDYGIVWGTSEEFHVSLVFTEFRWKPAKSSN